jgi:hypothetical protein
VDARSGGRREVDADRLAVAHVVELEVHARREAPEPGDEGVREHLDLRVVRLHVAVVDPPRRRDLVLGVRELLLELPEGLGRAQLRERFGDREQPPERLVEDALGGAAGGRAGRGHGPRTRVEHRLHRLPLVLGVR